MYLKNTCVLTTTNLKHKKEVYFSLRQYYNGLNYEALIHYTQTNIFNLVALFFSYTVMCNSTYLK